MATVLARPIDTPPSPHLSLDTTFPTPAVRIPNKHIPYSDPGPAPEPALPPTPPATPSSAGSLAQDTRPSLLHPPTRFTKLRPTPPVYAVTAPSLLQAIEHLAAQPLPDAHQVFPWLHGLTADNQIQLSFFRGLSKNPVPPIPSCLRGLTIVKCGGDLTTAKLKGAVAPEELIVPESTCRRRRHASHCDGGPCFHDIDPLRGFSVRNFKIQCCKMATVSDIVVYGDDNTPRQKVEELAHKIAKAQATWRKRVDPECSADDQKFNTFVLTQAFAELEVEHPELVAVNSRGELHERTMDFPAQERIEMATLTKGTEIAHGLSFGQTAEMLSPDGSFNPQETLKFDILIEANDYARMPEQEVLDDIEAFFLENGDSGQHGVAQISFPSSGSCGGSAKSSSDVVGIINMCRWIHKLTTQGRDESQMDTCDDGLASADAMGTSKSQPQQRRIFVHCSDGYTESSLLALAYTMFVECLPAHEAFIHLHRARGRDFFAYPADKEFLESVERRIMSVSPKAPHAETIPIRPTPTWAKRMDGSLPSRVMDYLYLGNLLHANNPGLLKQLGITHVLSVGEPINWGDAPLAVDEGAGEWSADKFCFIDGCQDNGVDSLADNLEQCLDFIANAKAAGGACLVHCRVGVSRSATICIAEVMSSLQLSFPRAYCFVRARRLNVIIQPHLRFVYELLKWEERLTARREGRAKRECEWAECAREIAAMNKPYCRD